ncbi:hypothetical protein FRC10_011088, partial [Ceratobasidium sp. 414]
MEKLKTRQYKNYARERTKCHQLATLLPLRTYTNMKSAILLALTSSVLGRTFTVYNACPFTIWPAVFTDLNAGSATPSIETSWEAAAHTKRTFTVPDNWKAGRIWGRRNCNFATNPGPNSCATGGCNGGLLCNSHAGTGVPPPSVAEWTLDAANGLDWYDALKGKVGMSRAQRSKPATCRTANTVAVQSIHPLPKQDLTHLGAR